VVIGKKELGELCNSKDNSGFGEKSESESERSETRATKEGVRFGLVGDASEHGIYEKGMTMECKIR
jgi:hypothetical protein